MDVVRFCKEWLNFYPYPFLYIIPGGSGRWGGYPFATGIVAIHGQETFKEGEPLVWWRHITSHEIRHEYWGEWVLDPDNPDWLRIGMGIFIDTEYMLARHFDPEMRVDGIAKGHAGIICGRILDSSPWSSSRDTQPVPENSRLKTQVQREDEISPGPGDSRTIRPVSLIRDVLNSRAHAPRIG